MDVIYYVTFSASNDLIAKEFNGQNVCQIFWNKVNASYVFKTDFSIAINKIGSTF